jgi:hypothetical protein
MKVRRIVTGHNTSGKAVVKTDEQLTAVPRVAAGMSGCEMWSTDQMPIDNSEAVHLKPGDVIGFSDQPHLNKQFRQVVGIGLGAVATPQCRLLLIQSARDIQ